MREEQSVTQLWRGDGHPRDLVILDNDFFGNPQWRQRIGENGNNPDDRPASAQCPRAPVRGL
jgi:hypothetical protein